jgi:hypothetical protein
MQLRPYPTDTEFMETSDDSSTVQLRQSDHGKRAALNWIVAVLR